MVSYSSVKFEVFTVVTMKNAVFWDVTPCGSCKNQCFRETCHLHHQGDKNRQARYNVSSNLQPKHAVKNIYVFLTITVNH
jgi:hypothetical protein